MSAFTTWQQFGTTAPNELAMSTVLTPGAAGQLSLTFDGTYYGPLAQFNATIRPLVANLPASFQVNATALDWLDGLVAADGSLDTSNAEKVCSLNLF